MKDDLILNQSSHEVHGDTILNTKKSYHKSDRVDDDARQKLGAMLPQSFGHLTISLELFLLLL